MPGRPPRRHAIRLRRKEPHAPPERTPSRPNVAAGSGQLGLLDEIANDLTGEPPLGGIAVPDGAPAWQTGEGAGDGDAVPELATPDAAAVDDNRACAPDGSRGSPDTEPATAARPTEPPSSPPESTHLERPSRDRAPSPGQTAPAIGGSRRGRQPPSRTAPRVADQPERRKEDDERIPAAALVTLSELDAYARPRALKWEDIEPVPKAERREPTIREQAILAALVELRLLTAPQIHRRFLPGMSERTLRAQLQTMTAQGWLRRAHLISEGPGQTPRIFALAQGGWEQIKDARTRFRPFCVDRTEWRAPELSDPRRIAHDLHANAWYHAFERLAGHVVASVRGPHSARLYPPPSRTPTIATTPPSASPCLLTRSPNASSGPASASTRSTPRRSLRSTPTSRSRSRCPSSRDAPASTT